MKTPDDIAKELLDVMEGLPPMIAFTYKGTRRVVVDAKVTVPGLLTGLEVMKDGEQHAKVKSYTISKIELDKGIFTAAWAISVVDMTSHVQEAADQASKN